MISAATAEELLDVLRTVVRASRTARQIPSEEGLPQWTVAVLGLLAREGEQRLGKVAAHLGVDPSVMSRHVVSLEQTGLVTRRPDPADGRAQLLVVSDAGRAALAEHRAMHARWVAGALADWDDVEVAHLAARLNHVLRDLHRAGARERPDLRVAQSAG